MRSPTTWATVVPTVLLVAGCMGNEGPTEAQLSRRLSLELPSYWVVRDLDVELAENVGSKAQPLVKSRFHAELRLLEDVFTLDSKVGDVVLLDRVAEKGESRKVYGIATSRLKVDESWDISFELENAPEFGQLKERWTGETAARVLVTGSDEEREFQASVVAEAERAREFERSTKAQERQALIRFLRERREHIGYTWRTTPQRWPFRFEVVELDAAEEKFAAVLKWPTLGSVHRVEGEVFGTTLVFRGVEVLEPGQAELNCVYELSAGSSGSLEGTYDCPASSGMMSILAG